MTREGSNSRVKNLQSSYLQAPNHVRRSPRPPIQGDLGGITDPRGFPSGALKSFFITCKYFLPISRRAEGGEDGGDFRRQEGTAGETGQMRGGGVVDEQRLDLA